MIRLCHEPVFIYKNAATSARAAAEMFSRRRHENGPLLVIPRMQSYIMILIYGHF